MARPKSPSPSEGDFYIGADGRDKEGDHGYKFIG